MPDVTGAVRTLSGVVLVAVLYSAQSAEAHIEINSPSGGEVLIGDSVHIIEWEIHESHAFLSWDIWHSVTGIGGPWIVMASDLPPGDVSLGAIHSYNWTVPNDGSTAEARIWVRGTTSSFVDDAFSDTDFGIVHWDCLIEVAGDVNESGQVQSADIISMVGYVFKGKSSPQPCAANGDVNCSGSATATDIIYLVGHVFKGGPAPCDICNDPNAMECVP